MVIYTVAVCVMAEPCSARLLFYFFRFSALSTDASSKLLGGGIGYCDNSILYVKSDNEDFVDVALH